MPLPFQTGSIGALNCYSRRTHALGADDRALAEEVAAWIALAVGHADTDAQTIDELSNLKVAMKTRSVIEQAKGILVERFKITGHVAFTVLSGASQNSNIKLSQVAGQLVTIGVLRGQQTKPTRDAGGA